MLAIQYDRYGPPEVLQLREAPTTLAGPRGVRVRVRAAALNPKDVLVRKGKFKLFTGSTFPKGCGFDFAGEVLETAPGLPAGAHVFGMLNGWNGRACAQELVCTLDECAVLPPKLSFVQGAALPMAALTALQALRDEGALQPGARVAIHGASGGVGAYAVQLAKALGAEVTASTSARNLDFVSSLGADHVVDYATTDLSAAPERFELFFDVFGNQPFARARAALVPGGRYVSTVPSARIVAERVLTSFASRRARLVVVRSRRVDLEQLLDFVDAGQLVPVVARVVSLADTALGHAQLETKRTRGKVVVRVD